jgi:hypothetical protein
VAGPVDRVETFLDGFAAAAPPLAVVERVTVIQWLNNKCLRLVQAVFIVLLS